MRLEEIYNNKKASSNSRQLSHLLLTCFAGRPVCKMKKINNLQFIK